MIDQNEQGHPQPPQLLSREDLNFDQIGAPENREKIKLIFKQLMTERMAALGLDPNDSEMIKGMEEYSNRLKIFDNLQRFEDFFYQHNSRESQLSNFAFVMLLRLSTGGFSTRVLDSGEPDLKRYFPVVYVNHFLPLLDRGKYLLHELTHTAERSILMILQDLPEKNEETQALIKKLEEENAVNTSPEVLKRSLSLLGLAVLLNITSYFLTLEFRHSGIDFQLINQLLNFALVAQIYTLGRYGKDPKEIRARASEKRIEPRLNLKQKLHDAFQGIQQFR